VLQNKGYLKFAAQNTVEVICMEEIDKAERDKAATFKTYKTRDAYGDEVEYLVEFDGLTVEELKGLSNTDAVVAFMDGGKIPYTAIVDPHTGRAIEAIKGKPTVKSLSAAVLRARKVLTEAHGEGVPRKRWEALAAAEVRVDLLSIAGKYAEAWELCTKTVDGFKRPPSILKTRLETMREVLHRDIVKYVDACEKQPKRDAATRKELAAVAKALGDSALAKRAAELAKG
jgi:hypothetical protein